MTSTVELQTLLATGITEVTGRPAPALTAETTIASLGLDSLQALELVAWAEERLEIRVSDDQLAAIATIGELTEVLLAQVTAAGAA